MTNLNEMKSTELKGMAKELGVKNWWLLKKTELITGIEDARFVLLEKLNGVPFEVAPEQDEQGNILKPNREEPKFPELTQLETTLMLEIPTSEGTPEATTPLVDENIITLKEIIYRMGIKGTKARRLLRNSDIERPYKRWEWNKVEHKKIIEKVKSLLSK